MEVDFIWKGKGKDRGKGKGKEKGKDQKGKDKGKGKTFECTFCGKKGHSEDYCWNKQNKGKGKDKGKGQAKPTEEVLTTTPIFPVSAINAVSQEIYDEVGVYAVIQNPVMAMNYDEENTENILLDSGSGAFACRSDYAKECQVEGESNGLFDVSGRRLEDHGLREVKYHMDALGEDGSRNDLNLRVKYQATSAKRNILS